MRTVRDSASFLKQRFVISRPRARDCAILFGDNEGRLVAASSGQRRDDGGGDEEKEEVTNNEEDY